MQSSAEVWSRCRLGGKCNFWPKLKKMLWIRPNNGFGDRCEVIRLRSLNESVRRRRRSICGMAADRRSWKSRVHHRLRGCTEGDRSKPRHAGWRKPSMRLRRRSEAGTYARRKTRSQKEAEDSSSGRIEERSDRDSAREPENARDRAVSGVFDFWSNSCGMRSVYERSS